MFAPQYPETTELLTDIYVEDAEVVVFLKSFVVSFCSHATASGRWPSAEGESISKGHEVASLSNVMHRPTLHILPEAFKLFFSALCCPVTQISRFFNVASLGPTYKTELCFHL